MFQVSCYFHQTETLCSGLGASLNSQLRRPTARQSLTRFKELVVIMIHTADTVNAIFLKDGVMAMQVGAMLLPFIMFRR